MDTQHRWPAILAGIVMAFVLGSAGVKARTNIRPNRSASSCPSPPAAQPTPSRA